jgi:hypothetical protein
VRAPAEAGTVSEVVHLLDARTGQTVQLPPTGRHGLRLRVHLSCPGQRAGWQEIRVLLVADVLQRALESAGVQVFPTMAVPDLTPDQAKAMDRALNAYGIHPPAVEDSPRADVHIRSGAPAPDGEPGVELLVGPVTAAADVADATASDAVEEPLARRLTLLRAAHRDPVALGADELRDAAAQLAGWRVLVAAWSREPSAPIPAALREQARDALNEDLDTRHLAGLLQRAADDPDLADGARFETFLWVDRYLGLDLARDLGRA